MLDRGFPRGGAFFFLPRGVGGGPTGAWVFLAAGGGGG